MAAGNLPQRIYQLPDNLVNQIAAGEVIERPASVVKELLENSLDAGTTRIKVEIQGGGARLIRIEDNGYGIHADDLILAIGRHTTSKLHDSAELARIVTLGFRGEALSSIAAISRLTIVSRTTPDEHGWLLQATAGAAAAALTPAPRPAGTTVEVRDLFYNTPARRKFLRSDKTEFLHIQELCRRIALSRFGLSLRLLHNDREIIHFADDARQPEHRVSLVLGKRFLEKSLPVSAQSGSMTLFGWLGAPAIARSQPDQQYFFLNGRIIRDRLIQHAVRLAYADQIYTGRYPQFLLYLEMDVADADINVHPTKHEVRFRDSRTVHDFIRGNLARILNTNAHTAGAGTMSDQGYGGKTQTGWWRDLPVRDSGGSYNLQNTPGGRKTKDCHDAVMQLHEHYFLARVSDGVFLVDMRRARELIASSGLEAALANGGVPSRPVLVPLSMHAGIAGAERIEQQHQVLEQLGLVLSRTAPETVMIRALPPVLAYANAVDLVRDVIPVLEQAIHADQLADVLIEIFSRHANDSAPRSLTDSEMQSLLTDLLQASTRIAVRDFRTACRPLDTQTLCELLDGKA